LIIWRGEKLFAEVSIEKFKPVFDPISHTKYYEREWIKIWYKDERVWPHMFPNTLMIYPINGIRLKKNWVKHFCGKN
jgi:hypothetical protein